MSEKVIQGEAGQKNSIRGNFYSIATPPSCPRRFSWMFCDAEGHRLTNSEDNDTPCYSWISGYTTSR